MYLANSTMINRRFLSVSQAVVKNRVKNRGRKSMKMMDKRPIVQEQRARNTALEEEATKLKLDWRIMAAT